MSTRIEDYAMIGDCHTAALVSREGSIDWLCLPRFDSGACFAALLGTSDHGQWRLAPAGPVKQIRRHYRDGTLILETEYVTETGEVTVIDFMPVKLTAQSNVVRRVVGRRGQVAMHTDFVVRFDYGSLIPWVRRIDGGIVAIAGPEIVCLRSDVEIYSENFQTSADFTVSAEQVVSFVLSWGPSNEPVPPLIDADIAFKETDKWWIEWSSRCSYQGEWRDAVVRSLITLKGLTYAPTGGMVAAATTSLPEKIGGVRNWDYRYCWLRDATFTLYAFLMSGYHDEAREWRVWLERAVAGKAEQLNIVYGLAGERRLTELTIDWLPGYDGSAPVRIGNAAHEQFQLDVFGEVLDAFYLARRSGLQPQADGRRIGLELLSYLESNWDRPDDGIWEVRGPRQQFTHSKLMAWVAVDRAIKSCESFNLEGPVERWKTLRGVIHAEICQHGFNTELGAFVQYYGSRELDASLLMMAPVGFLSASDPRIQGTLEAIKKHLMVDGFVARYGASSRVDGLPPGEGMFLPCTFWLADNYVLQGRFDLAREIFERLLAIRNDVGLLSEEYDPVERRLLGNFPQAFSHVGLVNTAHNLSQFQGPAEHRQTS